MGKKENLQPPFTKNDPRINRKGRPRVLPELKEILTDILSEEITNQKGEKATRLEAILRTLNAKAQKGDMRAIQEVLDRAFGKAKSAVEMEENNKPVEKIIVEYVKAKDESQ